MALATNIKNEIKKLLEELVRGEVLKEVHVDDLKAGIFDRDYGGYPVAVLTTPSIEGGYFTNRQNERLHTFEIVVIHKAEEIQDATAIEDLAETILDKFDNKPTLNGKADGGVEPSTSTPEAIVSRGKTFVVFSVFVKAKAIKDLTF